MTWLAREMIASLARANHYAPSVADPPAKHAAYGQGAPVPRELYICWLYYDQCIRYAAMGQALLSCQVLVKSTQALVNGIHVDVILALSRY